MKVLAKWNRRELYVGQAFQPDILCRAESRQARKPDLRYATTSAGPLRIGGAALSVGLLVAWAVLLPGCDGSNETTITKPIESNILKKLGQANPSQGKLEDAKAKREKR
jgi:hypothetical protein